MELALVRGMRWRSVTAAPSSNVAIGDCEQLSADQENAGPEQRGGDADSR